MDSVTQFVLGAAIGEACLGSKAGRKAAVWGGILATLPDLDVLIPYADAVDNFTRHRSFSHSLFVLTLATPVLAYLLQKLYLDFRTWRLRSLLLVWLSLITHPLLDSCTVYGTQLFWPLATAPEMWSTVFIIDPVYTLPLLAGVYQVFRKGTPRRIAHRRNQVALLLSSLYLLFSFYAKSRTDQALQTTLQYRPDIQATSALSIAAPLNTILWRVVVLDQSGDYFQGFYSLLDQNPEISLRRYDAGAAIKQKLRQHGAMQRLQWFTRGFMKARLDQQGAVIISDLRMGSAGHYIFHFKIAQTSAADGRLVPLHPTERTIASQMPLSLLAMIWHRIFDPGIDLNQLP
ncbi:MAG: metal-dependent hydrolase [Leptospiraceae bacterium]|nr:metal-dependent hydrolase [Leptospiraceae bacterium]